jgi:Zn-dependent peptidase ImmA (M78 family)
MSTQIARDPQQEARKLLEQLKITTPPVSIDKVVRHLKAQVRYSPLDGEISGMIYIQDNVPIIGINSLQHPNRQRFTIAHECGHLVLHREQLTQEVHVDKHFPVLRRDEKSATGRELIEIQANQFAAELLMPKSFLHRALGNKMPDIDDSALIDKLAREFKMSADAMRFRIINLFGSLS